MRGFLRAPIWALFGGVLFGMTVLLLANGCRQSTTEPIRDGQHFTGKGFAIDFPQQWTIKEIAETTAATTADTATTAEATPASGPVVSATNTGGAENIVVEVEELSYDVPLDEYALFCQEKIVRGINGYKNVEALADFTGKLPGKVLIYTGEKDGVAFQTSAYFFIKGKNGYRVHATASAANFKKHRNTFDKVAASMTLH